MITKANITKVIIALIGAAGVVLAAVISTNSGKHGTPPEREFRTLIVDADSGGERSVTRQVPIPEGWTYVRHEEKVTRGGNGREGDGTHTIRPIRDGDNRIIAIEATAIASKHYGSKRNYYKVVVTVFIERNPAR